MPTKKSKSKTYAYWLTLGLFGAHRFYLGKTKSAILLLITSFFWAISFLVKDSSFGILALINYLEPIEKFLLQFGQIGRFCSGFIFIPILTFPILWWFTDLFRLKRWLTKQ